MLFKNITHNKKKTDPGKVLESCREIVKNANNIALVYDLDLYYFCNKIIPITSFTLEGSPVTLTNSGNSTTL